jgi:hypothetical protein
VKYELNNDDVMLITKVLDELMHTPIYVHSGSRDLAIEQRVNQIKQKLEIEEE